MNYRIRRSNYWLRLGILVAIALFTCTIAVACSPSSSQVSGESQEITVATEDDYPPYDFLQNGKHVGYNQELLELVTRDAPFTVKQEVLPFQGILTGIAANRYDATNAAIAILEERLTAVDFTMPITDITNYLIKRRGDSINSVADLAGKTVGVQQGSITAKIIAEVVNPQLKAQGKASARTTEYGAFAEAYQDLENKRVDAVLNNLVAITQVIKAKPNVFEVVQEPIGDKVYAAWAVKKGREDILKVFNDGLAKAKADGTLKQLQQKWLGVSFDLPNEPRLPGDQPIPTS
ncbi:amino acid ABC transporter substrate-binding protein, PAAT family [Gloeocapsa sp. PCC 7428]|uniref:transporter substrate-binding domain-containing protein n=1 Tax=Gloeocapsa sp. PCC 7428 TaxID=1173026 RepID=UPI0002A5EA92|nr:transporter substrate-binding domain-containing protein [Gloeocapsa sp. PCC 7428]AFZ32539.1 amino acid ABC transporter substrate-binding protein, PAAT family [Gloeocapsa sp. PCC 7428]